MAQSGLAHGSGREKTYGLAVAQLPQGGAYALHGNGTARRVVGCPCVDGDEVGTHGCYFVKDHVHHDFVLRSPAGHDVDKGYAVEGAERMVTTLPHYFLAMIGEWKL